jgi:hypothetical protein
MTAPATTAASAPTAGWQREMPRYRATRDLWPPSKPHFRHVPPVQILSEADDIWQYCGRKPVSVGDVVTTEDWPHPSFEPLCESARRVHAHLLAHRGRWLPTRPWQGDHVVLEDNGDKV